MSPVSVPSDPFRRAFEAGDAQAVAAVDEFSFWAAPFGLALLETVKLAPGLRALDIGCGMGFPSLELASRLGARGHVTGVDPWKPALGCAEAKATLRGIENVRFVEGRAERLPFDDQGFDLIVSNNGLNNVDDAGAAVGECARVCRSGAQLVMTVNLPGTFSLFYDAFEKVLAERGMAAEIRALHGHVRAKRKTADEWRHLLERAGFQIRNSREDSLVWTFLDGGALFGHWLIRLAFLPPWVEILPLDHAAEIMASLEGRLNRFAAERGSLHLEVSFLCLDACRA